MLNCVEFFIAQCRQNPKAIALAMVASGKMVTFEDLEQMAASAQHLTQKCKLVPGDTVLIFDQLSPRLYGAMIGLMASGLTVVMVEPWMSLARINQVIGHLKPKLFLTQGLGKVWGIRSREIRSIPHWISTSQVERQTPHKLKAVPVPVEQPAMVVFTSGTSGIPKGVVRTQSTLIESQRILGEKLGIRNLEGADLCIFASFALLNLSMGKTSLIFPNAWSKKNMNQLERMSETIRPTSLTCGPAFLLELMNQKIDLPLEALHVGGALTDCWIFEEAFKKWPTTKIHHLYGSSEAEPVASFSAAKAVEQSRNRGYFQTLSLGTPSSEIQSMQKSDSIWVSGKHVCPKYIEMPGGDENAKNKIQDPEGRIWHRMGDRINEEDSGWWYGGRSFQKPVDFESEQRIYSELGHSKFFLHRTPHDKLIGVGEVSSADQVSIKKINPEVQKIFSVKVRRDPRHRARLNRELMLKGLNI